MKRKDPVREFLEGKGCPPEVVKKGIAGLVAGWERVAAEVGKGYSLTLDDYLNDLDGRQILDEALAVAGQGADGKIRERVRRADRKMRSLVEPAGKCLWGAEVADSEGWNPEKNWWYFTRPKKAAADFLAEIDEV
jgi:hypothetical protein